MYIVRAISSHNFIIYTVTIHEKAPIFNSAKNNFRLLFIIFFLIQCNANHIMTISRHYSRMFYSRENAQNIRRE